MVVTRTSIQQTDVLSNSKLLGLIILYITATRAQVQVGKDGASRTAHTNEVREEVGKDEGRITADRDGEQQTVMDSGEQ